MIIILLTTLFVIGLGSLYYTKFYVSAKLDEWLLVVRNGKVIAHGIGMSVVRRIGD